MRTQMAIQLALLATLGRGAELRDGIGARGRQRVVDNWSWSIMARRTVEQYHLTIEDKRRGAGLPGPARRGRP